jgi:hypothetical protein
MIIEQLFDVILHGETNGSLKVQLDKVLCGFDIDFDKTKDLSQIDLYSNFLENLRDLIIKLEFLVDSTECSESYRLKLRQLLVELAPLNKGGCKLEFLFRILKYRFMLLETAKAYGTAEDVGYINDFIHLWEEEDNAFADECKRIFVKELKAEVERRSHMVAMHEYESRFCLYAKEVISLGKQPNYIEFVESELKKELSGEAFFYSYKAYDRNQIFFSLLKEKAIANLDIDSLITAEGNINTSFLKDFSFDSNMTSENDLNKGESRLLEVDKAVFVPANVPLRMVVSSADVLHA